MASVSDPAFMTVEELAGLIDMREISPVEIVAAVLERIRQSDDTFRSYISVFEEEATLEAESAARDIAQGRRRGPLHGIPVAIKDSIAVKGHPTTNGSGLWAERTTDFDATVVSKLRRAGAVILGKNNMHEWGMGGTCTDQYFGTVRNPWDLSRVPGGSSGGSAVAVASGLAVAAIGADGWGSIRTPASYCGVVGLMPTFGVVSRYGEIPATSSWHHTIGPITRTTRDAALVFEAIAGPDPLDPTSTARQPGGDVGEVDGTSLAGVRIGVPSNYFFDETTPEVSDAIVGAYEVFSELGAELIDLDVSDFHDTPLAIAATQHESQAVLLDLALKHPEGFATPEIRQRILAGEFVTASDRRIGMQIRNRMRQAILDQLSNVDAIVSPCNSTVAFQIGADRVRIGGPHDSVDMGQPGSQSRLTTRLTLPWNLVGVPAISIPSGKYSDGMPIAIQIAGRPHGEQSILKVAGAYETAVGGYRIPARASATSESSDLGTEKQ